MSKLDTMQTDLKEKHIPWVYHTEKTDLYDYLYYDKVAARYTHWLKHKVVSEEVSRELKGARNQSLTPMRPECHVCHYAGYSNDCEYSHTSCPILELRKYLKDK